jgi:hypothetical protein
LSLVFQRNQPLSFLSPFTVIRSSTIRPSFNVHS